MKRKMCMRQISVLGSKIFQMVKSVEAWLTQIKERFLGATALSFPGNGSLFNMWQRLAKMNPRLWHTGPRQSPKNHLAKKNSHYDWEIKRKILNTSFKRSFGRNRESPKHPLTQSLQQPSSTGREPLLKGRQRSIKNNEQSMKV